MTRKVVVPLFILLVVIAFGGSASVAAQPLAVDAARREADAFLEKARSSFSAGNFPQAHDMLAPALQLAPDYSEALYLHALLLLRERSTTVGGISDLRSALAGGSWTVTDPAVARQTLADALLRTGSYAEAKALLLQLVAVDPSQSRPFLLLARLYERDGETAALRRLLADAVVKFPLEDDFAILSARLLQREGRQAAARQLISTQLEVHPGSQALLLSAAVLAPSERTRIAAVDRYSAQGGKDPLAAVLALEAKARDSSKYLSQFVANGGLSHEDLVERVALAARGSRSLSSAFRSELSRYSGNRDLDPDGDGYVERWTFSDGTISGWVRDPRRDGEPSYSAEFRDGTPARLLIRGNDGSLVDLSYSTYPFLQSVKAGAVNYLLVPYTVKFPFLSGRPAAGGIAPRALPNPGNPSLTAIVQSSYQSEEYGPDGKSVARRTALLRGKRVFMEEDTLGTGSFDHRVWFENGQPARGARDLDGSGRFLITETWRDGRLAGIAVDTRGNGKPDYWERYGAHPMKSWDYNQSGVPDSREYPSGPDTVVRDFSTAMNGVYDVMFVWKGNDIVRVTRQGRTVPVTPDPARGVVWVGPPAPAGAVIGAGEPPGYWTIAGKSYLVFRYEGVTYAEELP